MPVVDEAEKNGKINASTSLGMGIWNGCKRIVYFERADVLSFSVYRTWPPKFAPRSRQTEKDGERSVAEQNAVRRFASHATADRLPQGYWLQIWLFTASEKEKKVKPPSLKTFSHERYTVWVSQKGATQQAGDAPDHTGFLNKIFGPAKIWSSDRQSWICLSLRRVIKAYHSFRGNHQSEVLTMLLK